MKVINSISSSIHDLFALVCTHLPEDNMREHPIWLFVVLLFIITFFTLYTYVAALAIHSLLKLRLPAFGLYLVIYLITTFIVFSCDVYVGKIVLGSSAASAFFLYYQIHGEEIYE